MAKRVELSEADAKKIVRILEETRPLMLREKNPKLYNLWREAHKLRQRIENKLIE